MIDWLTLLKLALSAVATISKIVSDKQLMDSAQAEIIARNNAENLKHVTDAIAARSAPGVPEPADPDNRDRM